ncbi:hypothetical protein BDR06DRAFT_1014555 [Suillus hirtellus]|nr:hypothetical protein BDR06DRAFT_1014555 [Suillus hirtellus]
MHACLSPPLAGISIRGSTPDHQCRKGCIACRALKKGEQHPAKIHHPSQARHSKCSRSSHSSDTSSDSSDDDIIAPITPPSILCDLSLYVKSAKERPAPYKRVSPNIIEHFCGEECPGCNGSMTLLDCPKDKAQLEHRIQSLSPEAHAQAVVAIGAHVEWRCTRAVAAALQIDAIVEHKKFMCLTLASEASSYANAVSESLETSLEMLVDFKLDELEDRETCSVATYELEAAAFTDADKQFDVAESLTCAYFHVPADDVIAESSVASSAPHGLRR